MEKINWKQKLSSRKLWAAFIGFVSALLLAFNVPEMTIQQVVGVITSGSVLIAYIVAEGKVDSARVTQPTEDTVLLIEKPKTEN
jgi:uncharacterized membrane protein